MKIEISLRSEVLICLSTGCTGKKSIAEEPELTYSNSLSAQFGDPYVLLASSGRYYMHGTGAGAVNGFCAHSSDDLIHWKSEERVYRGNTPGSRATANFWALGAYERGRKFYMFFNTDWQKNPTNEGENFHIGVVTSDKPTGPSKELADASLSDPGYPVIDGNLIENEDDRTHLYHPRRYYKHPVENEIASEAKKKDMFNSVEEGWIYEAEITPDPTYVIEEPVPPLRPPVRLGDTQSKWESHPVTEGEVGRRWTEGSFILRHNGLYYMIYSANYFGGVNYAVGYVVSEHPLGPFEKASNNPMLEKNMEKGGVATGTGHNSVT